MSPLSNPSGFRQVVELGNCQQNLGWWLHGLNPGTYYWSVQAIDNSFAGGPFAPEQTFTILPPIPVNNTVTGDTISDGEVLCFDATNTLTVGGNSNSFRVNPGAQVTLIAGQKIRLLTGTSVDTYGYLHGYIASDNQYCFAATQPIVASKETAITPEPSGTSYNDSGLWSVNVFPNPVSDILNIRITGEQMEDVVHLAIHNLLGKEIMKKSMLFSPAFQWLVSNLPKGAYLFSIRQGNQHKLVKLIR
jgi:hypothetical protein